MENKNAHRTAIVRKTLSAPTKYLEARGKLVGRVLDYGCGRGFDADTLDIEAFDPYYRPERPDGQFDTIICNYVLNVIEDAEVAAVLSAIHFLLLSGGIAYIAVRRDVKVEGWTKKGTFQVNRVLNFPVEYEKKGAFIIYRLEN